MAAKRNRKLTAVAPAAADDHVEMVAMGGFECEAHEGQVKVGATFTTSAERAEHLERLGAARRIIDR